MPQFVLLAAALAMPPQTIPGTSPWTQEQFAARFVERIEALEPDADPAEDPVLSEMVSSWSWHAFEWALAGLRPPSSDPLGEARALLIADILERELEATEVVEFFENVASWGDPEWMRFGSAKMAKESARRLWPEDRAYAALLRCAEEMERIGRTDEQAFCLGEAARIARASGRSKAALEHRRRALGLVVPLGNERYIAFQLGNLGTDCSSAGEYEECVRYHREALPLFRRIGFAISVAESLSNQAGGLQGLGRFDEALELHHEAYDLEAACLPGAYERPDLWDARYVVGSMVSTVRSLAECYLEAGRPDDALRSLDDVVRPKGPVEECFLDDLLADVERGLGLHERALARAMRANAIAKEIPWEEGVFRTEVTLARCYSSVGEVELSIEHSHRSLQAYGKVPKDPKIDAHFVGTALGLSSGYSRIGRHGAAEESAELALAASEELQDIATSFKVLQLLGELALIRGDAREAEKRFDEALALIDRTEIDGDVELSARERELHAGVRMAQARVERFRGATEAARGYAMEAAALGDVQGQLLAASLSMELDDSETAEQIVESVPIERLGARARVLVANLFGELGRTADARAMAEETFEEIRTSHLSIRSPLTRDTFADPIRAAEHRAAIEVALFEASDAARDPALALRLFELGRGTATVQALAAFNAGFRPRADARRAVAQERALTDELEEVGRRLRSIAGDTGIEAMKEAARLRREIDELSRRRDERVDEVARKDPTYASSIRPDVVELAELTARLDERTALLAFVLDEVRSIVLIVDRNGLRSFDLSSKVAIERAAADHLAALRLRGGSFDSVVATGRDAFRETLGPLHEAGALDGVERLVLVTHGALDVLPFATLVLPVESGERPRFLVETHATVHAQSATAWNELYERALGRAKDRDADDSSLFAVADPRIRTDGEDVVSEFVARRSGFERLVRTREEVLGVARTLGQEDLVADVGDERDLRRTAPGPNECTILLGGAASKRAVLEAVTDRFRYVHFAAHGESSERSPMQSRLLLSPSETDSGNLYLSDVLDMRLGAELVTLAACESQLGARTGGEGVISLTRGFLFAGAENVLGSTWRVDDRATVDLMEQLYRELRSGRDVVDSLRSAQCAVLERARTSASEDEHPYFWGAWMLWGAGVRPAD
ncbi:MAG: CHAT domain-containing tetratricopeptide repeat protein [Planctomycetota bacterium]